MPNKKYFAKIANHVNPFFKKNIEVNIRFVEEKEISKLSRSYKKKSKNVLTFSYDSTFPINQGDIVICPKILFKESKEQNKSFLNHLTHIFIHSMLHLSGFTHEEKKKREKMEKIEIKIMKKIGYPNPYEIL
nr:rRNA maturation RNase YbeY [bacterium endosymbiont of Pedicinus badii]